MSFQLLNHHHHMPGLLQTSVIMSFQLLNHHHHMPGLLQTSVIMSFQLLNHHHHMPGLLQTSVIMSFQLLNHHHHMPGLLQTSVIMSFKSSLSSVLLMSSLLGDSFLVTKLFRLSVHFVSCLPLLLVPQIFPLNICFSSPSALFICPINCSCLFLMVTQ